MEQIIEGWVVKSDDPFNDLDEIYLVDRKDGEIRDEDEGRQLHMLIPEALKKLGFDYSIAEDHEEIDLADTYIADNIKIQIYASENYNSLDEMKKKTIFASLGLLEFSDSWFGYSEFTIDAINTVTFKLGGHDLLQLLEQHEGRYVYLIVDQMNI
ncbi:hypothetical protein [Enterococcus hulanensis]|uniref:hypothetical protein n=1 Tax=Enterococcus hulanensis TaxID=2559929 RepID=UPI0010F5744F|nr:hypothetical protein [Enterococcus hulanensis]